MDYSADERKRAARAILTQRHGAEYARGYWGNKEVELLLRDGNEHVDHVCELNRAVDILRIQSEHLEDLRDGWQRGALVSHDSQNGQRSNRNYDCLAAIRDFLSHYPDASPETIGG